jgi:hypothetical protein
MHFVHPPEILLLHKSAVIYEQSPCLAPNLHKPSMKVTRSLYVLHAAMKVKVKKAHVLYTEKGCDSCHTLLYF